MLVTDGHQLELVGSYYQTQLNSLFSQVVFQVPSADCALSLRQEVPGKDGSAAGKAGDSALAGRFHHTGSLTGSLGHVERGGDILCHVAG